MGEHEVIQRIADARGRELDRAVEQIAELEAERDRLRDALAEVYFHLGPPQDRVTEHAEVPRLVEQAMAERDRLRAVVEASEAGVRQLWAVAYAAREFDAAWSEWRAKIERGENVNSQDDESRRRAASIAGLIEAVRLLDGSADMGGSDG
jgi:hypothetical protein